MTVRNPAAGKARLAAGAKDVTAHTIGKTASGTRLNVALPAAGRACGDCAPLAFDIRAVRQKAAQPPATNSQIGRMPG
jgi:hypothetical protein